MEIKSYTIRKKELQMNVLVVVDMQNDFVNGALGSAQAAAIVPNVAKKVQQYQDRGDLVIFTRDTHSENYLQTQEGKNLPVPHCIRSTHGWEITDALSTDQCPIVDKVTFGSWDLPQTILNELADCENKLPDSIELVGLCTDICVISNAMVLKAHFPEVPIKVDSTCCAGVTSESHTNALNAMKMCQIAVI